MRHLTSLVFPSLFSIAIGACAVDEGADEDAVVDDELDTVEVAAVNADADHIVVYDNNVENLVTCTGKNWDRLFEYIKHSSTSPDIFTIQQISDIAQLDALTARMTHELPGTYAGVIAVAHPGSMGYPADTCAGKKNHQTNAIIYRTDRFTYEAVSRWRSDAPTDLEHGTGACINLTNTPTSQDRVENVAIRLYDRVAHQRVSVASFHWPTKHWFGPNCADENLREANAAVDGLGGTLKIVNGDANTSKGTRGWWSDAVALGFHDPIAQTCPSSGCPDSTSTFGAERMDFMLVKSGHGFSGARTINESSTGGAYSDHRAIRANVFY